MFFVMLNDQRGGIIPMVRFDENENETLALFESEEEANAAAESNMLGKACGYEVFERGCGC